MPWKTSVRGMRHGSPRATSLFRWPAAASGSIRQKGSQFDQPTCGVCDLGPVSVVRPETSENGLATRRMDGDFVVLRRTGQMNSANTMQNKKLRESATPWPLRNAVTQVDG